MRGEEEQQPYIWSHVSMEERIPSGHPLRDIRKLADTVLVKLSDRFGEIYSHLGRPSIPPEYLLRALLLQVLFSVRSERQLMEQTNYNLLFRWFIGLSADDPVWDASVFSKNRDRLLEGGIADEFFRGVLEVADDRGLISDEHFTIDGTLLEAAASLKSFQKKGVDRSHPDDDDPGNPSVNFHGEKRRNDTHESATDPDARLFRKGPGKESRLSYMGHLLMENRNGLAIMAGITRATGTAERDVAAIFIERLRKTNHRKRITLGADKGYDVRSFVTHLRTHNIIPHIAQHTRGRRSAVDHRTARSPAYAISQKKRKLVEEIFGWLKNIGLCRKLRFRGPDRVGWFFRFSVAVYNLLRISNLQTVSA
jgi:transposase